MAKSVRLSDYLYEEVERLARAEKRSLANMVKVLLEQALSLEERSSTEELDGGGRESGGAQRVRQAKASQENKLSSPPSPDSHFKPDFGSKLK
jgi:hypothetical protein